VELLWAVIQVEIPKPDSWWPQSWATWLSFILLIISSAYNYIKFKERPFASKVAEVQGHFDKEVKRIEQHFDVEIQRLERRVNEDLNGFGRRVQEFSDRLTGMETVQDGMNESVISLVRGEEEAKNLQLRIFDSIERARTERQESERRILEGNQRVLDRLTDIAGRRQ
jgi:hypothetical protein